MPQTDLLHLAMFADDTAIITQIKRFSVVISNLRHYLPCLNSGSLTGKLKLTLLKVPASCLREEANYPLD
ncbi:hypothetical protein TNCV_2827651 [Trichonephila clavipes]|nr:hypothetical protein TNCV_2827651 [Trichonephila clavipes]